MLGLLTVSIATFSCVAVVWLWRLCHPDKHTEILANQIPGPRPLPLLGNVLSMAKNGQDELAFRIRMKNTYGDIYRHWLGSKPFIGLSDPKDIEVLLKNPKEIRKSIIYDFLEPWLGTGMVNSTGDKWAQRRKALTPAFHFKILEQFMEVFNRKSSQLTSTLQSESTGTIDMMDHVVKTTISMICETAMGLQTDCITDEVSKYLIHVRKMSHLIADRISKPLMFPNFMWRFFGQKNEEDNNVKILRNISTKVIREKEEQILKEGSDKFDLTDESASEKKKMALLEMMLRMKLDGNPVFRTNDDIFEETDTIFFAGHDTVATAVCFTCECLARHPSIQEELYVELRKNIKDIDNIKPAEFQNMPFFERVLKETLRLYPPAPIISRHLYNDVKLPSGYTIPGGSLVAIVIYLVHRNSQYYQNPDEFNPDNFLPERVSQRHPFAFIPFSAGPRNCMGQKYAMLEFKTIASKILYNFRVELPEGEKDRPLTPYEGIVLRAEEGHRFVLRPRSP